MLDGCPVTCTVQVCDIIEEAVLGLDLLSTLRCCWDWDQGVLRRCPSQVGPVQDCDGRFDSWESMVGQEVLHSAPSVSFPDAKAPESPPEMEWDCPDMGVIQEPTVGLEGLWADKGWSSEASEDWEEPVMQGIRSLSWTESPGSGSGGAEVGLVVEPPEGLPNHLVTLYGDSVPYLSDELRPQLASMLKSFVNVFSRSDHDLGRTSLEVHRIPTGDARPVRLPPRRAPMHLRADIEQQIQTMLDQGIVEECTSPWAAPLVVVKKKDGSNRICVDYRALNEVTEKDAHPIPRVGDSLDALAGATVFSTLDMTSGYHQVEVAEADRDKTAFVTGRGHHLRYVTMPFGLCNAPGTFQRLMERVLHGLVWKYVVVYLDDVVIFSRTHEEHIKHLTEVFHRFEQFNLKLKPRKCEMFRPKVKYLGHVVSAAGVATDPGLIDKVKAWEPPRTQKEVRAFLGLAGYYRAYVPDFGVVAEPLVRLTDARAEFHWTQACQEAFLELKRRLVTAPILAYPNQTDPFVLDTDASDVAIGAVLSQRQGEHERVIAYGSRALTKEERNYCVTRRELLAVVHFVEAYRYYLYGRRFVVRTDHSSLRWMLQQKEPRDQLARWIQRLSVFQFDIEHRPGKKHGNADGMSRKCFRGGQCFHPGPDEEEQSDYTGPHGAHVESPDDRQTKSISMMRATEVAPAQGRSMDPADPDDPAADPGDPDDPDDPAEAADRAPSPGHQVPVTELSLEHMREGQRADPDLKVIWDRIEAGLPKPEKQEISRYSPAVKYWCARWDQLQVREGVLQYRWEPRRPGDPVTWKILAPQASQELVMAHVHDLKAAGHMGISRTWAKAIRSPYIWAGMRADLARWVRRCRLCQQKKPPAARKRARLVTYQVGAPWERAAMDVAGPFPTTATGNKYILVVQDYFTKWVEVFAMPDQTAETIASCLVDNVFARFGCCREIHSDRGTNFLSQVMREVSHLFGVKRTTTTSFHPRGDGMVERANRTLEGMLALWTNTHQDDWDVHLPLLAMAYRSAPHETTAETPNMMALGREVTLPVDLFMDPPPEEGQEGPNWSQYAARLQERLRTVHEAARGHMTAQMVSQKRHYDKGVRLVDYEEGNIVWLHDPTRRKGRSPKLERPWKGPFLITCRINDVNMRVQASPRARPKVVHVDRLKPCVGYTPEELGFGPGVDPTPPQAAPGDPNPRMDTRDNPPPLNDDLPPPVRPRRPPGGAGVRKRRGRPPNGAPTEAPAPRQGHKRGRGRGRRFPTPGTDSRTAGHAGQGPELRSRCGRRVKPPSRLRY